MLHNFWEFYKLHERKINVGLAIFGVVTFFISYFFPYNTKPKLVFYINHKTNIIELSKPVPNLNVLYKNNPINTLQLIRVRVKNDGSKDIEESSFASNVEFGLLFPNSEIASAYLVNDDGNTYLKNNVVFTIQEPSKLLLNKLILENDKFYEFEVLLIRKSPKIEQIQTFGKITGQDIISVNYVPYISMKDSILKDIDPLEDMQTPTVFLPMIIILIVLFTRTKIIDFIKTIKNNT